MELNVSKILQEVRPVTVTGVKRFLGLVGHYRRFIKNFARIAEPLHAYTRDTDTKLKGKTAVEWTVEAEAAFCQLKDMVSNAPCLAFADYDRPFKLTTDASLTGLGAVLSQVGEDKKEHPVAFASRAVTGPERRYDAHKLEFLALKWACTGPFKEYLWGGQEFEVQTDNNPLTHVLTAPNLDATGHRWVASLASYNFSLKYKKGVQNVVADALSRIERGPEAYQQVPATQVKDLLDAAVLTPADKAAAAGREPPLDSTQQPAALSTIAPDGAYVLKAALYEPLDVGEVDWVKAQEEDEDIQRVRLWLKTAKDPHNKEDDDRKKPRGSPTDQVENPTDALKALAKKKDDLRLRHGLVYHKWTHPTTEEVVWQFLVPARYQARALRGCHEDAAHQGRDRTLALLKERFFWPGMATQAEELLGRCQQCRVAKAAKEKAPLTPIMVTRALELVHMDFVTIEIPPAANKSPSTFKHVMVLVDHFTKHTHCVITANEKAETAARALWDSYFMIFGTPAQLLTDRAAAFESKLFAELCALARVRKLRTTPARPQCNGQVERTHQTIMGMLRRLTPDERAKWDEHLPTLVHAYNATRNPVTGYSPYFLFFGRRPKIAVDYFFPSDTRNPVPTNRPKAVLDIEYRMRGAYAAAAALSQKAATKYKVQYDRNAKATVLRKGDIVLLRQDQVRGRQKLRSKFKDTLYVVQRRLCEDLALYVIQDEDTGRDFVRHRDKLFPLYLAEETKDEAADGSSTSGSTAPAPAAPALDEEKEHVSERKTR
jgi:transposase InsO family protein